jgi:cytochrome d ubiquinol oxidase subunit I
VAGINEAQARTTGKSNALGDGPDRHPLRQQADPGIHDIKEKNRARIVRGIQAVQALEACAAARRCGGAGPLQEYKGDLGFGLLLKKYVADVRPATPAMIDAPVDDTVPRVRRCSGPSA